MSVDNTNVIDLVSIDKNGNVILTISDHLEWDLEKEHFLILQDKINSYLAAVENGDLYENYPNARDRNIIIRVIALHNPKGDAKTFLDRVKEVIESAGYHFVFEQKSLESL